MIICFIVVIETESDGRGAYLFLMLRQVVLNHQDVMCLVQNGLNAKLLIYLLDKGFWLKRQTTVYQNSLGKQLNSIQ